MSMLIEPYNMGKCEKCDHNIPLTELCCACVKDGVVQMPCKNIVCCSNFKELQVGEL